MKTIVAQENRDTELSRWRGAHATLWIYNATHRRMAIMLSRPAEGTVLYVVAVGCHHIEGRFSWGDANLRIDVTGSGETIRDRGVGFELQCSSVTLVSGPANELDTSFDHFLGDAAL
jgi:hypothetical protein